MGIPVSEPVIAVEDVPLIPILDDPSDTLEADFGSKSYPNPLIPMAKDLDKYALVDMILTNI